MRFIFKGNKHKFEQNEELKRVLLSTSGPITFRGSTAFWCKWNGLICDLIREELRESDKRDIEKINRIKVMMDKYAASAE